MAEWKSGQVILGEYAIEKELGRGGMGRVWLVKSQSTGRHFAVKQALIRDEKHRKAFLTELQTWIDLPEHPNIVPCRFFRTVGDEIVIFADYIEGGSLADWIAKGKLTGLEQIVDVAIQFAWGLHAIHERGLIHQDVKPGNVLMTPEGVPMVTDFGLARARLRSPDGAFVSPALPPGPIHGSVLVSSGGMTPAYASPEQRNGKPLSRKTDIWSWGVSILDMFMGGVSCPHGGHIAAAVLEALADNRDDGQESPSIPVPFVAILNQCFHNDPAKRWPSLLEAADASITMFCALIGRNYSRQLPHCQRPQQSHQHDRRVHGASYDDPRYWLDRATEATGRTPRADNAFTYRREGNRRAQAIADLILYEEARNTYLSILARVTDRHIRDFADLCMQKALVHLLAGDSQGCLASCDEAIEVLGRLSKECPHDQVAFDLAGAYLNKAHTLLGMGHPAEAVSVYSESIPILESIVKRGASAEVENSLALGYVNKANALMQMGRLSEIGDLYDKAIHIRENLARSDESGDMLNGLATAYMNKATCLKLTGDITTAVALYERTVSIREQLVHRDGHRELSNDLAMAYQNLASILLRSNRNEAAAGLCEKAIRIREQLVITEGKSELAHDLAQAYMNKGNAMLGLKRYVEADDAYDRAIDIWEKQVQQMGRIELAGELGRAYHSRANALCRLQRNADAIVFSNKAIQLLGDQLTHHKRREYASDFAVACEHKLDILAAHNDHKAICALFELMANVFGAVARECSDPAILHYLAVASTNTATEHARAGDYVAAVSCYRKGIDAYTNAYEKHDQEHLGAELASAKGMLAFALLNCGKREEIAVAAGEAMLALLTEYRRSKRQDIRHMLQGLCSAVKADQWFKKQVEEQE